MKRKKRIKKILFEQLQLDFIIINNLEELEEFKKPILEKYEKEGSAYYSSARLWDDGVIEPHKTRDVLGLAIAASLNNEIDDSRFGVFRM